jgi:hypothetical protein
MQKAVAAIGLAGLLAAGVFSPSASAAPVIPLSKAVIGALGGDLVDAGWRRCWRDRWGRMHCRWCWRDRWGRVTCR